MRPLLYVLTKPRPTKTLFFPFPELLLSFLPFQHLYLSSSSKKGKTNDTVIVDGFVTRPSHSIKDFCSRSLKNKTKLGVYASYHF